MRKINEIWLPDEDVELSTGGLKQWIQYCKVQNKKFKQVLDCDSHYGIWSRSMRFYSNEIFAFENRKNYVKYSEKNLQPINHVKFNNQIISDVNVPPKTFTIDYFNFTKLELIKLDSKNVITYFGGAQIGRAHV